MLVFGTRGALSLTMCSSWTRRPRDSLTRHLCHVLATPSTANDYSRAKIQVSTWSSGMRMPYTGWTKMFVGKPTLLMIEPRYLTSDAQRNLPPSVAKLDCEKAEQRGDQYWSLVIGFWSDPCSSMISATPERAQVLRSGRVLDGKSLP